MTCDDVRETADSFLCEELLTETNLEILRHLDACPACAAEIAGRRRLRGALRAAFTRAPDLMPRPEFGPRLRQRLRAAADHRSRMMSLRWFAIAAALLLSAGLTGAVLLNRPATAVDALARDAIGDHRQCALKLRAVRTPVPLEEAARRFDDAYRMLLSAPPDEMPTPDGPVHVTERHSCAYGGRRFGHVILEYRGRVVSLLMTALDGAAGSAAIPDAVPQLIGRPANGLSVVSVTGTDHAIVLVGDIDGTELRRLSRIVSAPLVQRLRAAAPCPSSRFRREDGPDELVARPHGTPETCGNVVS